ncbi:VOC family protein [Fodinibius sp. Rm-B-1B1-1]|uniref:VOC family protein n=1 Tax=Fodinibius alkaliphilus TaxID=3140241 RepID=UPI00315B1619
MKTKNVWANLSVEDVERTYKFYKALGFRPNGEFPNEYELASFFVGEDDFVVHFFSHESLKPSLGGEIADLTQGNEVMFTLSADSKEEVDEWAEVVQEAGGTLFSKPQNIRGNNDWYSCGFADPDGHKWNVFYNGK